MIYTVFCPGAASVEMAWQSELLGYSWGRARQAGELVQLVPRKGGTTAPCHPLARVVETQSWSRHPYTADLYPPYEKAAALLEWLFVEKIEGTVLLLEPTSVFRRPLSEEVRPGGARGTAWSALPRGDGPFGLGAPFAFLSQVCVDRDLELAPIQLPVLIHSTDLRRIVARWLELMSIIRAETERTASGAHPDADKVAYAIAAAEARISHCEAALGVTTAARDDRAGEAPIIDYRSPISSAAGQVLWDGDQYRDWHAVSPEAATPGVGREFLTLLGELLDRRAQGLNVALLRPHRQKGVREGKILGSVFLEIPGRADTVSLNSSGAAIWEVCDGTRNLAEINVELEARFEMPPGSLGADVEVVIKRLEGIGALRLEPA